MGDAYYEVYIREYLIKKGLTNLDKLHKATLNFVSRTAQMKIYNQIMPKLSEEELSICKRGRNYHFKERSEEYLIASGLEALIGYLYLLGKTERLEELMQLIIVLGEEDHHE